MNILEATTFLNESVEASENLEQTAIKIAKAVKDADDDLELAESSTDAIIQPAETIDEVATVGAQFPMPPGSDIKPVVTVMGRLIKLTKKRILPAIRATRRITKPIADALSVIIPKGFTASTAILPHAHDAKVVTEQLLKKFPKGLPKDVREQAERITSAASRAEDVLKQPLHEVDDILVGLHKLDPLVNVTTGLKGIHDTLAPVVHTLDQGSKTFGHFLKPFTQGLKKINDAMSIIKKTVEGKVEAQINKLLHKLGLKGDIFKTVEHELHSAEDALTKSLWTPIQHIADEVQNKLAHEQHAIEAAIHGYVDLTGKLTQVLSPLDDLLVAYIAAAKKHGVHPAKGKIAA